MDDIIKLPKTIYYTKHLWGTGGGLVQTLRITYVKASKDHARQHYHDACHAYSTGKGM